ncbi:MAG: transporter substrate-binding domain-containing protein [Pseudomonadota bacterium]
MAVTTFARTLSIGAFAVFTTLALVALPANPAAAQVCGEEYAIEEGDTLGAIAARVYGDPNQWTVIFYANQDRFSDDGSLISPGVNVRLPCIGRSLSAPANRAAQTPSPTAPAQSAPRPTANSKTDQPGSSSDSAGSSGFLISSMLQRLQLLTADGYPPFTGRSLPSGGMMTELLTKSMSLVKGEADGRFDYSISWINDWAAHLNPLLISRAFDVGFPYSKPDCDRPSSLDRVGRLKCERFFFSDPLYEVATLLYARKDSNIRKLDTADLQGKTICRPLGWSVHEFEANGRNWLRNSVVVVVRPPSFDACFQMLADGRVDSVAADELTARSSIAMVGLQDQVEPLNVPLSFSTLHVVVTRTHPHARTILYYTNEALRRLKATREYDQIVDKHLSNFWSSLKRPPSAAFANQPAASNAPRASSAVESGSASPSSSPDAAPSATDTGGDQSSRD